MRSQLKWATFSLTLIVALVFMTAALSAQDTAGKNLVVNGDFESGNSGFTTDYTFGDVTNPGGYFVGPNPSTAPGAMADWCNCGDHTTGTGKMMIVNGTNTPSSSVWKQNVTVTPSTNYMFSYWGAEVDHDSNSFPRLKLMINGKAVGSSTFPQYSPDNNGKWQNYKFTWNSGSSQSAELALVDGNLDSSWNDFAIDDISFMAVAGPAGGASSPAKPVSSSGPIVTHAQVEVKDVQGVVIPLKQEEKIAFMFMEAISSMEDDCRFHAKHICTLAELVAGPKSPDWNIGRLKYDPSRDPNYKYTVTPTGNGWTASASPQHAGLGGFFVDGTRGVMVERYYNANGPATTKDRHIDESSVSGEIFQLK